MTQLAKTRRVLFVEGKDFQILGRFAKKIGLVDVANRRNFAVVPIEGFNVERIRNLKDGMKKTLGTKIVSAALLDRDYRCNDERSFVQQECSKICDFAVVHERKEIENFLLIPSAIDRAFELRIADRQRRTGKKIAFSSFASSTLASYADECQVYVVSRVLAERKRFERARDPSLNETSVNEKALKEFHEVWRCPMKKFDLISGKDALSWINKEGQEKFSVSITPLAVIDAMHSNEIPAEVMELMAMLEKFSLMPVH